MWTNRNNIAMIWLFVFALMFICDAPYSVVGLAFLTGLWTIAISFIFRLYNKLK